VNPIIAAALIAGGISVVSFGFNAWTTSRTLHAARAASLRDRQAAVYQRVLAFASHQTETRRNITRTVRYDEKTEARLQGILDAYAPPDWFELESQVLAFCPDSAVEAFIALKAADDAVWAARLAHAEAVKLNQADPTGADLDGAVALQATFRARINEAEMADSRLIGIVRDKMLGTRPPERGHSLIGEVIFVVRSRASLR
jgi:hypothetical protein